MILQASWLTCEGNLAIQVCNLGRKPKFKQVEAVEKTKWIWETKFPEDSYPNP